MSTDMDTELHGASEHEVLVHRPGQEHAFYAHQDPRWLVCDCGQLAQRTRTPDGLASLRLIDPPARAFAGGVDR
jgi:hypothetical protein